MARSCPDWHARAPQRFVSTRSATTQARVRYYTDIHERHDTRRGIDRAALSRCSMGVPHMAATVRCSPIYFQAMQRRLLECPLVRTTLP